MKLYKMVVHPAAIMLIDVYKTKHILQASTGFKLKTINGLLVVHCSSEWRSSSQAHDVAGEAAWLDRDGRASISQIWNK